MKRGNFIAILMIILFIAGCVPAKEAPETLDVKEVQDIPEEVDKEESSKEIPEEYIPYLTPGEQTQPGPATIAAADSLPETRTKRGTVINILKWTKKHLSKKNCPDPMPAKRTRTAEEVIASGCVTGCIDAGLAFVTIARYKGIPAVYITTEKEEWIRTMQEEGWNNFREGHVFSEVYLEDEGAPMYVNPAEGVEIETPMDDVYLRGEEKVRYLFFSKGLDSWDLGLRKIGDNDEAIRERYGIEG